VVAKSTWLTTGYHSYDALRRISYVDEEFKKVISDCQYFIIGFWREAHCDLATVISEIDLTLRLQAAGYIVRVSMIASRYKEWFREGVLLTQWDYVANLEKSDIGKLSSRCVRC